MSTSVVCIVSSLLQDSSVRFQDSFFNLMRHISRVYKIYVILVLVGLFLFKDISAKGAETHQKTQWFHYGVTTLLIQTIKFEEWHLTQLTLFAPSSEYCRSSLSASSNKFECPSMFWLTSKHVLTRVYLQCILSKHSFHFVPPLRLSWHMSCLCFFSTMFESFYCASKSACYLSKLVFFTV